MAIGAPSVTAWVSLSKGRRRSSPRLEASSAVMMRLIPCEYGAAKREIQGRICPSCAWLVRATDSRSCACRRWSGSHRRASCVRPPRTQFSSSCVAFFQQRTVSKTKAELSCHAPVGVQVALSFEAEAAEVDTPQTGRRGLLPRPADPSAATQLRGAASHGGGGAPCRS